MTGGNQPRWLFHWTIRVCSFALVVCFANFGFSLTTPHFILSLPMDTFFPVSNKRLIAHEENPIVHLSLLKLIHCFLSGTLFRGSKWGDMAFTANGWNFGHFRAKLVSFLFNYDYNIQNVLRHFLPPCLLLHVRQSIFTANTQLMYWRRGMILQVFDIKGKQRSSNHH